MYSPFAVLPGLFSTFSRESVENLRLQPQCTTQRKTLPDKSFGRVFQNTFIAALFQRTFCDFTAVSGVSCRSLRNLFAQDQGAGIAARKMESAGLFVLSAQLLDGTAGCGQLFFAGSALHGKEVSTHLHQRQFVLDNGLTERHARAVLRLPENRRSEALITITKRKMNARATDLYIEQLLNAAAPGRHRISMVKDVRIFVNTIDHAIRLMTDNGVPATAHREERDGYIEYTVRIPTAAAQR